MRISSHAFKVAGSQHAEDFFRYTFQPSSSRGHLARLLLALQQVDPTQSSPLLHMYWRSVFVGVLHVHTAARKHKARMLSPASACVHVCLCAMLGKCQHVSRTFAAAVSAGKVGRCALGAGTQGGRGRNEGERCLAVQTRSRFAAVPRCSAMPRRRWCHVTSYKRFGKLDRIGGAKTIYM